jgi:2-oxoglutarate dehydrogenase E2 component (dihydrolipoamide succinyltransferase)
MSIELIVPKVGESITEVMVAEWLIQEGGLVARDANIVVLESDKATVELPAPSAGRLTKTFKKKGEIAKVGEVIGLLEEVDAATVGNSPSTVAPAVTPAPTPIAAPIKAAAPAPTEMAANGLRVMPAAQLALEVAGLTADAVSATGPGGRVLKEDVQRHVEAAAKDLVQGKLSPSVTPAAIALAVAAPKTSASPVGTVPNLPNATLSPRGTEVVPMSMLRRKVAERLVQAQQNAALLTTFNEIDMSEVMSLRQKHQDGFTKKYGIKLGFMSFFVRAVVDGLRLIPGLNAQVRGTDIIYHHYCDIGVAVGGGKGLVVPVLRNAEAMSFSTIEKTIADLGKRAQANTLGLEELQGGTFTISNGGIYGSLLSTPIVNPPQSGILGMHAIQDRPIALNGQVVIRPMMYVALTYDHRLVDGREAVTFLKRVKEALEDPARILLEV